jgi:dihydropteroate synthase
MTDIVDCGGRSLAMTEPSVMGILNVTPDSFSDGGLLLRDDAVDLDAVLRRAEQMLADGAAILDVGGESTRPGAAAVSAEQEAARVLPVVEALAARFDAIVSVDTSNPELIREAALCGAGLINDVRALRRDGALQAAADSGLPVCLMHMQGEPASMQDAPRYDDVVDEVRGFLAARIEACAAAGINGERILLDPGFGFGKTLFHNLELLRRLDELHVLGRPLLVGVSRKSMIGRLTGRAVDARLPGGLALTALAVERGASVVRTHDVAATLDAVRVAAACCNPAQFLQRHDARR